MKFINKENVLTIQLTEEEVKLIINALNEHTADDMEKGNKEYALMEELAELIGI